MGAQEPLVKTTPYCIVRSAQMDLDKCFIDLPEMKLWLQVPAQIVLHVQKDFVLDLANLGWYIKHEGNNQYQYHGGPFAQIFKSKPELSADGETKIYQGVITPPTNAGLYSVGLVLGNYMKPVLLSEPVQVAPAQAVAVAKSANDASKFGKLKKMLKIKA